MLHSIFARVNMTRITISYDKTKSNPFALEIHDCDGVEQKTRKISFGTSTMKDIEAMTKSALAQHKAAKLDGSRDKF